MSEAGFAGFYDLAGLGWLVGGRRADEIAPPHQVRGRNDKTGLPCCAGNDKLGTREISYGLWTNAHG